MRAWPLFSTSCASSKVLAILLAGLLLSITVPARADVSSWLFFGAGPSWLRRGDESFESQPSLQMETGLGGPPDSPVVLGGLARVHTHFGSGTDLALLLRGASSGFVAGDWGAGLDLGAYQRFWGAGSTGGVGSLVLGAPWGITASISAGWGTGEALSLSAVLGIDLARLTIYRSSGTNWWSNPFPSPRPQ
jgi:hypothetical protein